MKWRKTDFPLYETMYELVVGTVATGEGAFRPGRDFSPVSTIHSAADFSDIHEDMDGVQRHAPLPNNSDDEQSSTQVFQLVLHGLSQLT